MICFRQIVMTQDNIFSRAYDKDFKKRIILIVYSIINTVYEHFS